MLLNKVNKSHFAFRSKVEGPNLLVFGGIHGNEPCGVLAILRLVEKLESGEIKILKGSLELAFGNLEALAENIRYLDRDMNRMFLDDQDEGLDDAREYERVKFLKTLFPGKHAFLDLHSASSPTQDFLLAEGPSLDLATKLNASYLVTGWENFESVAGDTEKYAAKHGLQSMTYEAGQHQDQSAVENAFAMILKFLGHYGVIEYTFVPKKSRLLRLEKIFLKQSNQQSLEVSLENFIAVKKDQLLIAGSNPIYSPFDGYLVFPVDVRNIKLGEVICFLARQVEVLSMTNGKIN